MNDACILLCLAAGLCLLAGAVIWDAARSLWRELMGLADDEEGAQARRTERRKNERIQRELERRRGEEEHPTSNTQHRTSK